MTSVGNGHLNDQQLLHYVDGELTAKESTRYRTHLEACWTCRAKLDDLNGTIKKIVNLRNEILLPMVPVPPRSWDGLDPLMRKLEETIGKRSITERLGGLFHSGFLAPRFVVTACLVLVALGALVLLPSQSTISANELLARVQKAQAAQLNKVTAPVIHQRLRVRRSVNGSNEQATTDYDSWGDQSHGRFRQTGSSAEVLSELRTICDANHLDWQAPLSASGYARWRDSLPTKQDYVAPGKMSTGEDLGYGSGFLALTTVAGRQTADNVPTEQSQRNVITKAELVVRTTDWHPVEGHLLVNDWEFEIAELDYGVLPLSAVAASVFAEAPAPVMLVEAAHPHLATRLPRALPDPDETEVLVRYKLHQLNADIGEPIEISRDSQGKIVVDASRAGPELQAKLKQELVPMPNTELRQGGTVGVACDPCPATSLETPAKSPSPPLTIVPTANPNEKRLEEIFGDPDAKESFTQEVLAVSEGALSRSFALRDLALRYPPEVEARLGPEAKAPLEEMINDHFVSLAKQSSRLQGLLRPLLEALSKQETSVSDSRDVVPPRSHPDEAGKASGTELRPCPALGSPFSSSQWQTVALRLFGAVQKVDSLVNSLLPNTNAPIPADEVVPVLRQALSEQQELNQCQGLVQKPKATNE
jgi:hypothetical protein